MTDRAEAVRRFILEQNERIYGPRSTWERCAFCGEEFATKDAPAQRCVCNVCYPKVQQIEVSARRMELH